MLEIVEKISDNFKKPDLSNVKGCAFRLQDEVILNSPRKPIDDLDKLPYPAWHIFPNKNFPMYAGRGCPFRCTFCMRVLGDRLRLRSVDNVLGEIEYLISKFNVRGSWFQDETFGVNKEWTHQFCNQLIDLKLKRNVEFTWKANSRVNLADYDTYLLMKKAGCRELDFGIESGNQEILKMIKKNIKLGDAEKAINISHKVGITTNAFFILGHPNETLSTIIDTMKFAARLNSTGIAVGIMVPYPGTEIYKMAKKGEGGYKFLSEDWNSYDKYFGDALELCGLSRRKLEALQMLTYCYFYASNARFKELFDFIWQFRKEAFVHIRKLFANIS